MKNRPYFVLHLPSFPRIVFKGNYHSPCVPEKYMPQKSANIFISSQNIFVRTNNRPQTSYISNIQPGIECLLSIAAHISENLQFLFAHDPNRLRDIYRNKMLFRLRHICDIRAEPFYASFLYLLYFICVEENNKLIVIPTDRESLYRE